MPGCADVPIGFASVMAGECFELIGELTDKLIHNDLLVRKFPVCHLIFKLKLLQRRQDRLDVNQSSRLRS